MPQPPRCGAVLLVYGSGMQATGATPQLDHRDRRPVRRTVLRLMLNSTSTLVVDARQDHYRDRHLGDSRTSRCSIAEFSRFASIFDAGDWPTKRHGENGGYRTVAGHTRRRACANDSSPIVTCRYDRAGGQTFGALRTICPDRRFPPLSRHKSQIRRDHNVQWTRSLKLVDRRTKDERSGTSHLHQVRVCRGLQQRQTVAWEHETDSVKLVVRRRPLRYPQGWKQGRKSKQRLQENGADIRLAVDLSQLT